MKSLGVLVLLAMAMAMAMLMLAPAVSAITFEDEAFVNIDEINETEASASALSKQEVSISLHDETAGRLLRQNPRYQMTCDKYPRVCRVLGSPGPDCCKKKCVNVLKDRLNCGKCGKRCKYSEMCCKGKCVNPLSDGKHCGGCYNVCEKGSSCVYGMCSYGA